MLSINNSVQSWQIVSAYELVKTCQDSRKLYNGKTWGPWKFRADNLKLGWHRAGKPTYEIDLEKIRDAKTMLDWISHVPRKGTATHVDVGTLVDALDEIFDTPNHFATAAGERNFDPTKHLRSMMEDGK